MESLKFFFRKVQIKYKQWRYYILKTLSLSENIIVLKTNFRKYKQPSDIEYIA